MGVILTMELKLSVHVAIGAPSDGGAQLKQLRAERRSVVSSISIQSNLAKPLPTVTIVSIVQMTLSMWGRLS